MVRLSDPPAIIEFGHFSILPHRRQLLADGRPIRLGGRAFDLLLALLEARGAVVGKDELLSRIWPGRIVEENRLQSEISALRKALGADRDLIQTVSGRGYQFTGEIRAGVGTRQVPAPLAVPVPPPATNLCEGVSELIGREAALSEVTDHVTTDRLVTLTGEGEIDKPRLGLQAAEQVQPEFADGVRVTEHDAAERRQIAAMSCEAIGLAARGDGVDLEDLLEAIGAFQHCVSEIAGRHSGFIASRLGNTVLVPFRLSRGARTRRRGGDPRGARIVRGGQEPDADVPMRCRVGIATGMGHRW